MSAIIQRGRLNPAEAGSATPPPSFLMHPWFANILALSVLFTGIGVKAGTSGGETVTWNRGASAWVQLHAELHRVRDTGAGKVPGTDATTVTDAIPWADARLAEITGAFWQFSIPWVVCLVFSMVAASVMSVGCLLQVMTLARQIGTINQEVTRVKTGSGAAGGSTSSALASGLARKEGLVRVLRNVIATSVALSISMLGYVVSCIVGELASNRTRIFQRHRGEPYHPPFAPPCAKPN